jgi:hypothetical protein
MKTFHISLRSRRLFSCLSEKIANLSEQQMQLLTKLFPISLWGQMFCQNRFLPFDWNLLAMSRALNLFVVPSAFCFILYTHFATIDCFLARRLISSQVWFFSIDLILDYIASCQTRNLGCFLKSWRDINFNYINII